MLFGRVAFGREGRLTPIVEQIVYPAFHQRSIEPVGEAVHPIGGWIVRAVAAKFRKIMRETTAADNQHALVSQRRQSAPRR